MFKKSKLESIVAESGISEQLVFNRQVIVLYSDSKFDHPNHWTMWKRVEKAQKEREKSELNGMTGGGGDGIRDRRF